MTPELERRLCAALAEIHGEQSGFAPHDYLHAFGSPSMALLSASLFLPSLVEVDGCVLLARMLPDEAARQRFRELYAQRGREAARSFSWLEIPYQFGGDRETSEVADETLAECVAASWRAWIPAQFPGRTFVVEVLRPVETGSVVGIGFFETT